VFTVADHRDIRGRAVVITGASSGFGKGAALRFAGLGANLVLAARRQELLEQVARDCELAGVRAVGRAAAVDLTREGHTFPGYCFAGVQRARPPLATRNSIASW
jgi:short-subunit dehydrogenase